MLRAMLRRERRRGRLLPWAAAVAVGVAVGAGAFTFAYGDGLAYLSNDPAACANCHVMQGHLESWGKSAHHHVAVCNDCHLPPDFFGKWLTKADNGMLHSLAFTLGGYPDPIRIKPRNAARTQRACLACHGEMAHAAAGPGGGGEALVCASCHADVGHAGR